ncbi:MAG: allene oxide cyclase barrel-like domain-containing protein [Pseudonocardiaceae bacterium]
MRWKLTVAILSIVVLGLGFGHSALAGPNIPNIPNIEKVIVLTGDHAGPGTLGLDTHIEAGRPDGIGDQDLFSDDLRDKAGKVVGRSSAVCITTSPFAGDPDRPLPQRGANLCTIGSARKDGKITVSGIVTDDDFASGVLTIPIVGGTGKYHSATGQLETKFALTFTDPATLTSRLSTLPFGL